jgi:hypothetical protein
MSTDRYFDKFPVITYSNNQVVDITRRVALLDKVSRNPYVFYPYDITSDERAEQFSSRYYQDAFKSWMLYLGNKITDPYYEWYLTEREFLEFLEKKYGSIFNAQQKVKYYRNNWESQEPLTVSGYNALDSGMQKYWNPVYGVGSSVMSYSRKEIDWTCSTNKIISYSVANTSFIKDEIVNIYLDGNFLGKGQIAKTTNTEIYAQHVSGFFQETDEVTINSNGYIYGTESFVNTAVTDATTIVSNIEENELNYWKAYTYYDYEVEKNEFNKSIRVIDSDYAETAVNNLTELMGE